MTHIDAQSRNPIAEAPIEIFDVRKITEENWLVTVQNADFVIQRIIRILTDPEINDDVD